MLQRFFQAECEQRCQRWKGFCAETFTGYFGSVPDPKYLFSPINDSEVTQDPMREERKKRVGREEGKVNPAGIRINPLDNEKYHRIKIEGETEKVRQEKNQYAPLE